MASNEVAWPSRYFEVYTYDSRITTSPLAPRNDEECCVMANRKAAWQLWGSRRVKIIDFKR
ncbi:MAG: hypothetical protein K2W94_04130 [Alphaproteobacteria bacterium]|nr:hypothetical protein [Alphaproteobacteria bacterium]